MDQGIMNYTGRGLAFHLLLGLVLLLSLPGDALANRGTVFVAHRGGIVDGFPENTLAAFKQAIAQGIDAIEIDLRATNDGEVVILHDETLERTTDGRGRVIDHTLAELRRLDAGGGQRIPTYEEVLRLVAGTRVKLLLDIKESPQLDKARVVHLTEQHGAVLDVIVGVRSIGDLREFRRLNPNLRTLGFVRSPDDIETFARAGVDIIRLWPRWIEADPGIIARVHRLGLPVWCTAGTASRSELERLIRLGVNGVLTDFPELVRVLRPQ
jgi:glycerophosphoryl diester phosphodiesterase